MANFYPPGFEKNKKTIALDFDGVIHNDKFGWHDGTIYGDPIDGSIDAIKLLAQKYRLILLSLVY